MIGLEEKKCMVWGQDTNKQTKSARYIHTLRLLDRIGTVDRFGENCIRWQVWGGGDGVVMSLPRVILVTADYIGNIRPASVLGGGVGVDAEIPFRPQCFYC